MKLQNINGFDTIDDYVEDKINRYRVKEKNFETLFSFMFSEKSNAITEESDGYRIKRITYGECENKIKTVATAFASYLVDVPRGSLVGLYMDNSLRWIQAFWSILMCGYSPVFLNARVPKDVLEQVISDYEIKAVVSDSVEFNVPTHNVNEIFEKDSGEEYVPEVWGKEIFFMSSGTTGMVKLCAYTGENFFYQICDSVNIIKKCPQMKEHYEGELKILALLPFYHVFGFIAVYVWFTFFSRTLVFLKDMNPQTVLKTIKKHNVTHIFAVPLVWEIIYKKAIASIKEKGDATYKKFKAVLSVANNAGAVGRLASKLFFDEVRSNLFGDSIKFLISGGSAISKETLSFFNGIGYHMANGFGMTEIGITSVEISMNAFVRNKGSVGYPFECTEYSISEKGELLVRGKTMASRILHNKEERLTDFNAWFNTKDLVVKDGKRYYHQGRRDDLIVCKNGENLNPELLEKELRLPDIKRLCLFADKDGIPTLLASIEYCFSAQRLCELHDEIKKRLSINNLQDVVKQIALTTDELLSPTDFKISRKKLADRFNKGSFNIIDMQNADTYVKDVLSSVEKKIIECFAQALQKDPKDIKMSSDFFTDLGGSSIDYFVLLDTLKGKFSFEIAKAKEEKLSTPQAFYDFIKG